jgi:hypothetical protein
MLNWCIDSDCFECSFLPARDNVPAKPPTSQVVQRTEALGEQKRRLERGGSSDGE